MSTRVRRSLLFVPGSEPRRLERARDAGADTLLFDLEDSVPPAEKATARRLVVQTLAAGSFHGCEPAVRVNAQGSPYFAEDLAAVVEAGAAAIMLPKAEHPDRLREVVETLSALERDSGREPVAVLALVETAAGVVAAPALAASSPRVQALCFGHADFCLDMGLLDADPAQGVVLQARCSIAIAAKAAGVDPIDNVCLAVRDEAAFIRDAALGVRLGFEGKMCIHPTQVRLTNEAYAPTEVQVERARQVVAAAREAAERGIGVFALDDKMIDAPVVAAAERVLVKADRLPGG